jgi:hypothetical protein
MRFCNNYTNRQRHIAARSGTLLHRAFDAKRTGRPVPLSRRRLFCAAIAPYIHARRASRPRFSLRRLHFLTLPRSRR